MINFESLKYENVKKSKMLNKMAETSKNKMYQYLSGLDADSSCTLENIKYVMEMQGGIQWEKVEDPSNALFNIGYSDQGNIIGILTNANALLQDMLLYCDLEKAKKNLTKVLSIEVGSEKIIGRRYVVNGESPLTFSLPIITQGGYRVYAVTIHNKHADQFIEILKTLDVDALKEEDMLAIAKDISFISRTQELAIDVAKDKTITIVDTSTWLNMGVVPANNWLAKQDTKEGWYAKENLKEIVNAKKDNAAIPTFKIEKDIPDNILERISEEVITSDSIAREILRKAAEDYFNNEYKDMLLYSRETSLNQKAKALASQHTEAANAFKDVLMAYRSFLIDNIPDASIKDADTSEFLRKLSKNKTTKFAKICRNTIYKIGEVAGLTALQISLIAYGIDLKTVSKNEGKYFRAVMPEEFRKLYAGGKKIKRKQKLFFLDEYIEDDVLDGEEIRVNFVKGAAYDELGLLIAKTSYKYDAENALLIYDELSGRFYAEVEEKVELPEVGSEVLVRISDLLIKNNLKKKIRINYTPKSPHNSNVMFVTDAHEINTIGRLGYKGHLNILQQGMLIQNEKFNSILKNKDYDTAKNMLKKYEKVKECSLFSKLTISKIIEVNKESKYEANYAIINL